MERYAQLSGNTIANVIESETDPDGINGAWVACGDAGPGWTTDDGGLTFQSPSTIEPAVRRLTKLAYMHRFTKAELETIYTLAKTVVAVEVWLALFNATTPDPDGTSIDLDDPRTIAGVQELAASGILGPGRAGEILA